MDSSLQCTIDRFEGEQAVLSTEKKQEIIMPKSCLPESAQPGSVLVLRIETAEMLEKQREQTAKDILNELFGKS